jgi:hypothetical protein
MNVLRHDGKLGLESAFLPSSSSTTSLNAFIMAPMRATCSAHLIYHILVTVIIVGNKTGNVRVTILWRVHAAIIAVEKQ